jgi:orotate phosphoribosyltransferase-like protein
MKDDCSTQKSTAKRSLSYDMISGILLSQEVDQRAFAPDVVIGVARAGIVPSAMVATNLSLPLLSVSSNRTSHKVAWLLPPHPGTNQGLASRSSVCGNFLRAKECVAAQIRLVMTAATQPRNPTSETDLVSGY